jgi:hypothetical protein
MTAIELKNYFRSILVARRSISQEVLVLDAIVDFISQSLSSAIPAWASGLTFNNNGSGSGAFTTYLDTTGALRFWNSKTNGNIGNVPPTDPLVHEDTYWLEVSPSDGSALKEWAAGIYLSGLQIVFYNHSIDGDGLYKLAEPSRPFTSVDIEAEISTGKWIKFQENTGNYTVSTAGSTITCNWFRNTSASFVGSSDIAANKTIAFSNASNAKTGVIILSIAGSGPYDIVFPSTFFFEGDNGSWTDGTKTLQLYPGKHKIRFEFDGTSYLADLTSY